MNLNKNKFLLYFATLILTLPMLLLPAMAGHAKTSSGSNFDEKTPTSHLAKAASEIPQKLVAGDGFTCAVTTQNRVACWGEFFDRRFIANSSVPRLVKGVSSFVNFDLTENHACEILVDGSVKCWGSNFYGQAAFSDENFILKPTTLSGITDATDLETGPAYSCVITSSTVLKCWGDYISGFGGSPHVPLNTVFTQEGIIDVKISDSWHPSSTCILTEAGDVYCWGNNEQGQLGRLGDWRYVNAPGYFVIGSAKSIGFGNMHACAVIEDGHIFCWGGLGRLEVLGNPNHTSNQPEIVKGITNATAISIFGDTSCALLSNRTVKCWGWFPASGDVWSYSTPKQVISNAKYIATGAAHVCAILVSNKISCVGAGSSGQLGNGKLRDSISPVEVKWPKSLK